MADLVSVIIPTYNRAHLLPRAIGSVLAQTYQPMEIIVVDDGSTDDTAALLVTYGDQVKAIRQPNRGVSSARNVGLQQAQGEYITFLDSDDLWGRDKIATQVAALCSNPDMGVVYTWYITVDENGEFLRTFNPCHSGDIFKELYFNNFLVNPSIIMARRRCFWDRNTLKLQFDTNLAYGEDWKLWFQLSLSWKFCCVPKYLVCVTDHPKRVMKTGPIERILRDQSLLEDFLWNDQQAAQHLSTLGVRAKAVWPTWRGYLWFFRGERRKALAGFLQALRIDPLYWPIYTGIAQTLVGRTAVEKAIGIRSARHRLQMKDVRLMFPDIDTAHA